jgi:phenylacetic acid degradation operon negative regulatory protein
VVPSDLAGDLVWFGSTLVADDPAVLAARLWDLPGWAGRAEQLLGRIGELIDPLKRHDRSMLAQGFVLSADVLRHFQADPLLPADVLPGQWPGERLRRTYDTYDAAYRTVLREWFVEQT